MFFLKSKMLIKIIVIPQKIKKVLLKIISVPYTVSKLLTKKRSFFIKVVCLHLFYGTSPATNQKSLVICWYF